MNIKDQLTCLIDQQEQVLPPCQTTCPIHQDVQRYTSLIAHGLFDEALTVVRETNPLPLVCGLVCNHPCEVKCRRDQVEQAVNIRALKRAAVEYGGRSKGLQSKTYRKEKIAIIGSGPAGLSGASDLAKLGYPVTIFEASPKSGGMLRYGIPEYRLPKELLDKDIVGIINQGVEIKINTFVSDSKTLFDQGYKAIFLAIGAAESLRLSVPGKDAKGVYFAIDLLKQVNSGLKPRLGEKVVIIGGGSVAIDAARTALRLGSKKVHLVCLETRDMASKDKMLAQEEETDEAEKEGVIIHSRLGPKEILTKSGKVVGLSTMRCCSVRDKDGNFAPKFTNKAAPTIEADSIVLAIGQKAVVNSFAEVVRTPRQIIKVENITLETNIKGVFAGGDAVSGPADVVQAIANGKQAALSIDHFLKNISAVEAFSRIQETNLPLDVIQQETNLPLDVIQKVKKRRRREVPTIPTEQSTQSFIPIEQCYIKEDAVKEASRCLNCMAGAKIETTIKCTNCLTCIRICPYGAANLNSAGFAEISIEKCIACGLCASQCPDSRIRMALPGLEPINQSLERLLRGGAREKPNILGIFCAYSGLIDSVQQNDYPQLRTLNVTCISRVSTNNILKALELGADGIFIATCSDSNCRYRDAIKWAELNVNVVKNTLDKANLKSKIIKLVRPSIYDKKNIRRLLTKFTKEIRQLVNNKVNGGTRHDYGYAETYK
jgi:heterodisulfide reductase subunit A